MIEKLGLKAELRNPDEFYHKMGNAKFVDGEHKVMLKGNQEKARKLNEDRNLALVNMRRMMEDKKAEKMKKNLHLIDFPKANDHIRFVSSYDEIKSQARSEAAPQGGDEAPNAKVKVDAARVEREVARLQSANK